MRSATVLMAIALGLPLVAGCGSGGTGAPEDKAFQEELAKAAEANKGVPPKSKNTFARTLPPAKIVPAPGAAMPGSSAPGAPPAATAGGK